MKKKKCLILVLCFIFIFNSSFINVKAEGVGLASSGLAPLSTDRQIKGILIPIMIMMGLKYVQSETDKMLQTYIDTNRDMIKSNIGKATNGFVAISKDLISSFHTFILDVYTSNTINGVTNTTYLFNSVDDCSFSQTFPTPVDGSFISVKPVNGTLPSFQGMSISSIRVGLVDFGSGAIRYRVFINDSLTNYNVLEMYYSNITARGGSICIPLNYKGTFPKGVLDLPLKNEGAKEGSLPVPYTGKGDYVLEPTFDSDKVGTPALPYPNTGALPVPADTTKTGDLPLDIPFTGTEGVLNPDGTISKPMDTPVDTPIDTTVPKDISLDFTPLQVATTKFPFCIPWDLVNVIKSFKSTPKPPKWDVPIPSLVGVKGTTITIDMSKFEEQAKLVRYFILLAWVVFLILITRNLIRG